MIHFPEIQKILPHRYPFLLIDRVLEVRAGAFCKALKCVSGSEPFFQGHFPGNPLMPGVMIIEAMAQAGGIAVFMQDPEKPNKNIFFGGIEEARFRHPVVPGDQLILTATLKSHKLNFWAFEGAAYVDDRMVASALIKMMIS